MQGMVRMARTDPQWPGLTGLVTLTRKHPMRRVAFSLLFLLAAFARPGLANTFSTDSTDLWYIPSESGWGANLVQQNEIIFVTIFVYSATGAPTWFVGPATQFTGTDGNGLNFTGPLYQTTGPYYGAVFNPSAVTNRQVGTVTFVTPMQEQGRLTYTVDGVTVVKNVVRQTFRNNNLTGVYIGGQVGTFAGCAAPAENGYKETAGFVLVNHTGESISMSADGCTYSGAYVQDGRLGRASGGFSCSNGRTGNFLAIEMEGSLSGMDARLESQSGACAFSGRIGGVKRQQ